MKRIKQFIQYLKEDIQYLKDSKSKGWFSQYQKTGDVIKPEDRTAIQKATAARFIDDLQQMLSEGD